MGFGVPVGRWIKTEWREKTKDLLSNSQLCKAGYFDRHALLAIYNDHLNGSKDYSYLLFSLMVMELWYREFM